MKVHVEVERATESLHEGDGAHPRPSRSGLPRSAALEAEDRPQRNVEGAGDEAWVRARRKRALAGAAAATWRMGTRR